VPVASIRLKLLRDGLEDGEYLRILSLRGGVARAREIASALFANAYSTERSVQDVMDARAALAAEILARPPAANE
jgi:hypothetical protein